MTYAFDPELAPWVERLPSIDFTDLPSTRTKLGADAGKLGPLPSAYEPPVPVETRDLIVPGSEVPVRLYTPAVPERPLPGMLYFHGGGFFSGTVDQTDAVTTRIAAEVGAVVVSVEYRLAPEHRFPAGVEDCYTALVWAAKAAGELGLDPGRLAVGGDSSGGGLAAAVALLARDRGGPALRFQYLRTAELDDRLDTPSMRAYDDTPFITRSAAEYSWNCYLGEDVRGTADVSPYAAPARAEDLSGLPPAYVVACQFDPLRDEDIAYAQRLALANVPTELTVYPGTFHGCGIIQDAAINRRITADGLAALRRALRD